MATDTTTRLRRVKDSELKLGAPVPADLMDIKGRVLLNAGQMLDAHTLTTVKRHAVAGLYVGPEWPVDAAADAGASDDKVGAQIIRQLEAQHEPHDKRKGFKQRRHERRPWSVPLTIAVEERTAEGVRGRMLDVVTHNISSGGFAFVYNQYLHPGTRIHVQFDSLPNEPYLIGEVRNCVLIGGRKHRIGVQFIEARPNGSLPDFSQGRSAIDAD